MNKPKMEALVKSLLFSIVIISLCSCGRSSKLDVPEQSGQNQLASQNSEQLTLPKLNLHRVITIDSDVSTFYEGMTINSKKEGTVLGDNAFFIMINENAYPSYSEINLNFYNKTKVSNVFYFDAKKISLPLADLTKEHLLKLSMGEVTDFFKNGFIWGKRNLDNPENDMLNKAYVIRTEEMQVRENIEFTSHSTYLIWIECQGNIKAIDDHVYSCSKYNLKFHYKLLDYSLTSNKV
ncbi:MAG: hypothetical protein Q7T79_01350 [bacterium]|nr:hypothetical protein [bacterium]